MAISKCAIENSDKFRGYCCNIFISTLIINPRLPKPP